MKRCSKCNAKIDKDSKFCFYCGSLVESTIKQEDLKSQKNKGKKKKWLRSKVVITFVAVLLVACIVVVIIYKNPNSHKDTRIFYICNHDIRYGTGKEDESYKLSSDFTKNYRRFESLKEGLGMQFYIKLSPDHRFAYYPEDDLEDSYTYYWIDLDKIDEEGATKIDSDIKYGQFTELSDDGNKFFYIKGNSNKLYVYDRKSDETEKLDEDVNRFYVNKDGNYIIYSTYGPQDGSIYELILKDHEWDAQLIERDAYIVKADVEKKRVYYKKDEDLYLEGREIEKEKLLSDVSFVGDSIGQGGFHFTRVQEVTHKISDYVTDDLLESDCKITDDRYINEPEQPKEIDENDYKTIRVWVPDSYLGTEWDEEKEQWGYWGYELDVNAYNKACEEYEKEYDQWKEECDRVRAENYEAMEKVYDKNRLDQIREFLSNEANKVTYDKTTLFYWDGSKEHMVADDIRLFIQDYEIGVPAISYFKYKAGKEQLTISEIYNSDHDIDYLTNALEAGFDFHRKVQETIYFAYEETENEIRDASQIALRDDHKVIFIEKGDHTLKSADLTNFSDDTIETIDQGVTCFYHGRGKEEIIYVKNSEDGYVGDLYKDKKRIASNVTLEFLYFFPKSDSLLYIKGKNSCDYALYLFKDNKEIRISRDVGFFCPYDENNIAIIKDYDEEQGGDLELYKNGELIPIDQKVKTLAWVKGMGCYEHTSSLYRLDD